MSRRRLSALLALAASFPGSASPFYDFLFLRSRRRKVVENATTVECPRCHAAVGEECDRRTLGRWAQHMARVELLRAREQQAVKMLDRATKAVYRAIWGPRW